MQTSTAPAPNISLQEVRNDDGVTSLRTETKFALMNADIRKLDLVLEVNNRRVIHAGRESLVSSVYFDDFCLSSFRESLAGVGMRIKLRLRWYDSDLPGTSAYFEVKRRVNRLTMKERYAVTSEAPLGRMSFCEIINELLRLLPEEPRELLSARRQPVVLVRYRRMHYHARDPRVPVRITLDHSIAGIDQIGSSRLSTRFAVPLSDMVVLEVKSAAEMEKHIPGLIYPLHPRRSRFSKYGLCCSRIGPATGINESFM
jgi:SPX domain protein involved in polyphosphate accumulation